MKDIIKDMQILCLDFIQDNNLEEEYNKYCNMKISCTGFKLIDFCLWYMQRGSKELVIDHDDRCKYGIRSLIYLDNMISNFRKVK